MVLTDAIIRLALIVVGLLILKLGDVILFYAAWPAIKAIRDVICAWIWR